MLQALHFTAALFTLLALLPGAAHLFELPTKIRFDANEYLIAQRIYRGWAAFGFVLMGSLATSGLLALLAREEARLFIAATIATPCIASTLVVFFTFTFPANRATANWTQLPEGWQALRARWEWSHAVNALLTFVAVVALLIPAFWPSAAPQV
jgi:hypothetical protein